MIGVLSSSPGNPLRPGCPLGTHPPHDPIGKRSTCSRTGPPIKVRIVCGKVGQHLVPYVAAVKLMDRTASTLTVEQHRLDSAHVNLGTH